MKSVIPCAIYTRKSSEEGLEQGFNSLDAQREACEAFVLSQKEQGWKIVQTSYDDGGFSGGNTERPALRRLLEDIAAKRVRIVVVYKVDRLTRSLSDFAKMVELFDAHGVSFVSVTQQFNTTSSMGRLTLNVLLSFAQFEREVILSDRAHETIRRSDHGASRAHRYPGARHCDRDFEGTASRRLDHTDSGGGRVKAARTGSTIDCACLRGSRKTGARSKTGGNLGQGACVV